ncbi:hypothetical protein CsSME_00031428 [Camellia sinensis var. sinensis]
MFSLFSLDFMCKGGTWGVDLVFGRIFGLEIILLLVIFPVYIGLQTHGSSIVSLACSSLAPIAWSLSFARNLSNGETGDLASLLFCIDHLSLDSSSGDKFVWLLHSSVVFSYKSFFGKVTEKPNIPFFSSS